MLYSPSNFRWLLTIMIWCVPGRLIQWMIQNTSVPPPCNGVGIKMHDLTRFFHWIRNVHQLCDWKSASCARKIIGYLHGSLPLYTYLTLNKWQNGRCLCPRYSQHNADWAQLYRLQSSLHPVRIALNSFKKYIACSFAFTTDICVICTMLCAINSDHLYLESAYAVLWTEPCTSLI